MDVMEIAYGLCVFQEVCTQRRKEGDVLGRTDMEGRRTGGFWVRDGVGLLRNDGVREETREPEGGEKERSRRVVVPERGRSRRYVGGGGPVRGLGRVYGWTGCTTEGTQRGPKSSVLPHNPSYTTHIIHHPNSPYMCVQTCV